MSKIVLFKSSHPFNENSTVLYFDPLRNMKANTKPNVTPMLRVKTKFLVTGVPKTELNCMMLNMN